MAKTKKVSTGKFDDGQKVSFLELLEVREKNPFGTTNEADFLVRLDEMFLDDLKQLSTKAGISNSGNLQTLKDGLKQEFKRFAVRNTPMKSAALKQTSSNADLAQKINALLNA